MTYVAKNGTYGSKHLIAPVDNVQVQNPKVGKWVRRSDRAGQFMGTKKSGGSFKHVRREI